MPDIKNTIIDKIKSKEAIIGIIGLGYIGLPLMLRYDSVGFHVLGIDVDAGKVAQVNSGCSYIGHIASEKVALACAHFSEATSDFGRVSECDALILCLPTPLTKYREPNLSFVITAIDAIKPYLREGQVVSLESTTYPGTTEEELLPRIEEGGLKVGRDIFLVYSPEREDPGNSNFEMYAIPKIVGGCTQNCLQVGVALYEQAISRVVPVSSPKAAEMTKLLENIHRAVNVGLVNEMKIVADRMGVDIFEIIDSAATKPFGFTPYYPGPGLGGHCIPVDPFYLTWKAREYGLHTRFIELSGEINKSMPEYVVGKLVDALNDKGRAIKGSHILILGVAYKKNIADMRESPSIEIIKLITAKGGVAAYSDPYVSVITQDFELSSEPLTIENIAFFDAVVLVTDHDSFDYELIRENAQLIIDSRGRYRKSESHIVKS